MSFFEGLGGPATPGCSQPANHQSESREENQHRLGTLHRVCCNSSLQTYRKFWQLLQHQSKIKPSRGEPHRQPSGQQRLHGTNVLCFHQCMKKVMCGCSFSPACFHHLALLPVNLINQKTRGVAMINHNLI